MTRIARICTDFTTEGPDGKSVRDSTYTVLVRTTISLNDALVRKAEGAARKMGISRNQLFANAISEFLQLRRFGKITQRLNEIYSREPSELDPVLERLQAESLKR